MTTANSGDRETEPQVEAKIQPRGSIPADTFAARLVLARHFAGRLSIEQAARACGLNAGNWAHWEDGRLPRDKVDIAGAVAVGLDVDFNWLLLGGPLSPPAPTRRAAKRATGATERYPELAVRPTDTRPPSYGPNSGRKAGVRGANETGQRSTHPGGSEHRRPRRLKHPTAA